MIQDQHHRPASQRFQGLSPIQACLHLGACRAAQSPVQRVGDRLPHPMDRTQPRQGHKRAAARKAGDVFLRRLYRQARLADTARPEQGQQTAVRILQARRDLSQFYLVTDKWRVTYG